MPRTLRMMSNAKAGKGGAVLAVSTGDPIFGKVGFGVPSEEFCPAFFSDGYRFRELRR